MKALTLLHPWPFAVCFMGKDVENRGWKPTPGQLQVGERFAIHGAAFPKGKAWATHAEIAQALIDRFGVPSAYDAYFERMANSTTIPERQWERTLTATKMVVEGIVATAVLEEIGRYPENPWQDSIGHGWKLSGLIVLPEPIPCKGAQGLWNVPSDVLVKVLAAEQGVRNAAATATQAI